MITVSTTKIIKYVAPDGTEFDNDSEAQAYSQKCFEEWIDSNPKIDWRALIAKASHTKDEWYTSDVGVIGHVLQLAYTHQCKENNG